MAKETIQQAIGKFIYAERKKQNLSLAKLSIKAFGHVNYTTKISNIEKGLTKDCPISTIDIIMKGLGFDMTELFKI